MGPLLSILDPVLRRLSWTRRTTRVGKDLQGNPIQPSTYHRCYPLTTFPHFLGTSRVGDPTTPLGSLCQCPAEGGDAVWVLLVPTGDPRLKPHIPRACTPPSSACEVALLQQHPSSLQSLWLPVLLLECCPAPLLPLAAAQELSVTILCFHSLQCDSKSSLWPARACLGLSAAILVVFHIYSSVSLFSVCISRRKGHKA